MVRGYDEPGSRFSVLLTEDRPHAPEHWSRQLPRLLEPQGVSAVIARTGEEAIEVAATRRFHLAVVDVATPRTGGRGGMTALEGLWLLERFRRLPYRPPVVVVGQPAFSQLRVQRLLAESLRLGVFSVLNKPVDMNQLLAVLRRILDREYRGQWPQQQQP